jgi:DNA-binding NarL/FixJ family response regulator
VVVVSGVLDGAASEGPPSSFPRALLVDRQPLFLAALRCLMSAPPLNATVAVTTRLSEALEIIDREPVDVVICELPTEPADGTGVPRGLAQRRPALRIILLADRDDEGLLVDALTTGAAGFFTKDTPVAEFLEGVQAVHEGHFTVGRQLLRQTMARLAGQPELAERDELKRLSPTELIILTLVAHAEPIRAIAQRRGISQKTVRNHLASIYRKIGVRNRPQAILWAARKGLTQADSRA